MNKRKTGAEFEEKASRWLTEQGVQVMERNYRCRFGEIDLIGSHQGYLVFMEIKYRSDAAKGYPGEAVGPAKQKVICKVADYYRMCQKYGGEQPVRYDVVGICGEEIHWYQNAFYHQGNSAW